MEEKSLKIREKGITLIALVITIIVLLILAGVSIAMLTGENGILTQAQSAKEKSSVAEEKEKIALAYNAVKAKNKGGNVTAKDLDDEFNASDTNANAQEDGTNIKVTFKDTLREYIIDGNGNITEGGTGTVTPTPSEPSTDENGLFENTSTINGEPGTAMNPTIPAGFKPVDTETSTWGDGTNPPSTTSVNNGLVIEDINGSQFVWIPVPTPVSTTEEAGTENKAMAIKDDNNYIALLYDFSESGSTVQEGCSSSENYNTILNSREPAYLIHDTEGDDSEYNNDSTTGGKIVTQESMQGEYNTMMASVEKYKGFYVARYELGMEGDKPVSKSQKEDPDVSTQIANGNRWYGLYTKCKEYATKNDVSSSVGSSMIWGSQYDAMMNWMQKNSVNVIAENEGKRSKEQQTGFNLNDILKNIYDLYGCHYEWTLEARSNSLRIVRGGLYYDKSDGDVARTNAPAVRYENAPWHDYGDDSSRITLYVK